MNSWMHRRDISFLKLFVLSILVFNVLSESAAADKKPSVWKRVKKALLSTPAKVAYGCVAAIALVRYGKKRADENERARSLRNGRIVLSWLVENEHKELRGRFIDRYMLDHWHNEKRDYVTEIQRDKRGVHIIIRYRGVSRSGSPFLFQRIQGDMHDMNAHAESIGNPTCWITLVEKWKPRRIEGMPLREDFDKPRYQLKITIPNASSV